MTDREAIANLTYRRDCWIGLKYVNNEPEPWVSGILEEAMQKGAEALKEREERNCNCLETDDKYEYWGYWNICECGFNNIEGAKYCGGCGKKINIVGITEDYIKW